MKYKEGIVVQSIRPSFLAGTGEQAGWITITCPRCQQTTDYLYAMNKNKEIFPKYCTYCGEKLAED